MFSLIKRLQSKPKNKRRIIAFSVSAGFTFLIFVFWFSGMYLYGDSSSENGVYERNPSPFRVINRHVRGFIAVVGDNFSEIDEVLEQNNIIDLYENSENVNREENIISEEEKDIGESSEEDKEDIDINKEDPEKPPDEHSEFDEEVEAN